MNKNGKLFLMSCISVLLAFTDNAIKNRIENDSIKNGKLDKNGLFEIEKYDESLEIFLCTNYCFIHR